MLRSAKQLQAEDKAFHPCAQDRVAIRAWIAAAQEKAEDAGNASVSIGTRVEAAYDATFNIALAVVNASGWRHRAVPGHHAFVLEAACESIGATEALFDRLDAIRELRNQKYDGVVRTAADLADVRRVYEQFSALVETWLPKAHPGLFK